MKLQPGEAKAMRAAAARANKEAELRRERIRLDWARRHPEIAANERSLRKARASLQRDWSHKNEGTPETHRHASRTNQGALSRLYVSGAIDAEQLNAAVEIAAIAERIGADVGISGASFETRVDVTRTGDGSFFERLGQVRREMAYTRWRTSLKERGRNVAAVLDMLVGEPVGFTVVAKRYRMHNRRAKALLIEALDLWPEMLGAVCKEIDEADLIAAQAGILG